MKITIQEFLKYLVAPAILCLILNSCEKEIFLESKDEQANIQYGKMFVDSKPAGALIYLNDRYTGFQTPDTIKWVENGDARIKLKKNNFWDTTVTVRMTNARTESVLIDYYGNTRMYGNIICKSTPSGATIFLNNVNTGKKTPDTLKRLMPDAYNVKFEYPEFKKDSVILTVKSTVTSLANVTLEDTLDIVTYYPENSGFPANRITDIAEDKNGNIWVGTEAHGLVKFDGKKFEVYKYRSSPFIPADYVSQVEVDKDNNLWVGFSNALVKYDGHTWEKTDSKQVNSIQIAPDNTMLAATDQGGIIKYKNGKYDFIKSENSGLTNNFVTSACMDRNGNIWAALGTGGIDVYNGSSWNHLDSAKNGLPTNLCGTLAFSPDGSILGLFCTLFRSSGWGPHTLAKYDGTKWIPISLKNDDYWYKQIFIDNKNGIWLDLAGIIRLIDGRLIPLADIVKQDLRVFASDASLHSLILYFGKQVFIDLKDNLWIIGETGLIKIKKGRWNY